MPRKDSPTKSVPFAAVCVRDCDYLCKASVAACGEIPLLAETPGVNAHNDDAHSCL